MLIAELVNAVSQVRPALAPAYGLVELLIVGVAVRLRCSRVGAQALARRRVCHAGDAGRELARGRVAPAVAGHVIGDKPGPFRGVGGLRTGITVFLCRKLLAVAFATELRQHVLPWLAGLGILGPVVARAPALLLVQRRRSYAVVVRLVAPSAVAGVLEYGSLHDLSGVGDVRARRTRVCAQALASTVTPAPSLVPSFDVPGPGLLCALQAILLAFLVVAHALALSVDILDRTPHAVVVPARPTLGAHAVARIVVHPPLDSEHLARLSGKVANALAVVRHLARASPRIGAP